MSLDKLKKSDQGFTIFEVLIALFIIAMVFVAIPLSNPNNRQALQTSVDDIDRAVRFATNESVLRNTITRLTIDLGKSPSEYFVEFSTTENFLLPDPEEGDKKVKTLEESEKEETKKSKIDKSFSKIPEFEEMKREIHHTVFIMGAYLGDKTKMIKEGKIHLYFYPSGERDGALILFVTDDEVAGLEILSFQQKTKVHYEPVFAEDIANLEDEQRKAAEEIYSRWK